MKNVDSDIEQFEKNLIEIDSMRKQISELNSSLHDLLKETEDIDEIKNTLKEEIDTFHKIQEDSIKKITESFEKSISDVKLKQSVIEKKVYILIAMTALCFILSLVLIFVK